MTVSPISIKLQTNLTQKMDSDINIGQSANAGSKSSFSDHLIDAFQSTASDGHKIEELSASSNDATDLAMAMDQFLVELSALKALVDETRKAIDRVFQESRA